MHSERIKQAEEIQRRLRKCDKSSSDIAEIELGMCQFFGKIAKPVSPYLRSRDALEMARPENFSLNMTIAPNHVCLDLGSLKLQFKCEKIAEAYAIIEAHKNNYKYLKDKDTGYDPRTKKSAIAT